MDAETRLGPLATRAQQARVQGMLDRAAQEGARVLTNGANVPASLRGGFFVPPTLVVDVTAQMEIVQEEVFGPVLCILGYDSEAQATALANATRYGLSGAVWSRDGIRARDFARTMNTGQVVINGAAQNLATPFGGWGWSGFGRENGRFGIEDLLSYRSLHGA